MKKNLIRKEVILIAIYKSIEDFIRYAFGVLLIAFNFNLSQLTLYLFKKELAHDPNDFLFNLIIQHTQQPSMYVARTLSILLIFFSLLEISFLIALILRRKWGAIGFFIMQFAWVPIDIILVSKLFLFSKIVTITLEVVIIGFMIRLLVSPKGYFKK